MAEARDGMNYAPAPVETKPVVEPGEFVFAGSHFDHGHIYGQIDLLAKAGGELKYVYDADPSRYADVLANHPACKAVDDFRRILDDPEVKLVTSAGVPNERCPTGLQVMDAGKDYFVDKCPFTSLAQLEQARAKVKETGRKYMVNYGERLGSEAAWHAGELIRQGAIGQLIQIINLGPHNLNAPTRPAWFFEKEKYGGIITDIASHQFEQFLTYAGATDATINHAHVDNLANPTYPELEDFGECHVTMNSGVSCYSRVDWFTPGGLRTWGDGRTFVLGTGGYMELRKYIDITTDLGGNAIYLVDGEKEQRIACQGKIGFPFYGQLILDVLGGTEHAMTQAHAFKAAELSLRAQEIADENRT